MTRIPSDDRDLLEKAIYYPMVLSVLKRDLLIIKNSPFKLPKPYLEWIQETMQTIHEQLFYIKRDMKKKGMKVQEIRRDDTFTTYLFIYKGFQEYHSYFNPRIRNKVEELLAYFLYKRFFDNGVRDESFG